MLKKLREKKTAKKIWFIVALIIVPFMFWGSGSLGRGQKGASSLAGKIFNQRISVLELNDAMEAVRNQYIVQFGDNFSELQKYINLQDQAWQRIVLLQEAKKRNFKATDQEVIELIQKYPFFQRKDKFDSRIYDQMLTYQFRTQPRVFEEQVRQNIIISKLFDAITKDVLTTDEEIKAAYRRENEQMSITYISSLIADCTKEINPHDEELQTYFSQRQVEFKQPLSFSIEYVMLDTEDKVDAAYRRITKEKDFAKTAKEVGLELKESGLFAQTDPIPGIGWAPQILTLLSKLKVGQFAPVLQMDKNFYIIRLKEKKEPYIPAFGQTKDKVKEQFIKEKSEALAKEKIEACLAKLKEAYQKSPASVNLEQTAKECNLKFGVTELFKFGSYVEGIGQTDPLWLAVSGIKEDASTDIITMPTGFYIAKLKLRVAVEESKFEAEKEEFTKKFLQQKKQEAFSQYIEDLKRKSQLF